MYSFGVKQALEAAHGVGLMTHLKVAMVDVPVMLDACMGSHSLMKSLCECAASYKPPGCPRQGDCGGCTADTDGIPPEDAWFKCEMAWVLRPQHTPAGPEPRMGRQRTGRPSQRLPLSMQGMGAQ